MTQTIAIDTVEVGRYYYESGALEWEIPYVNGKMHGIEKGYFESGALWHETPYVNGEKHGIEKGYYESGALMWEAPYVDGKIHGISRGYDEGKTSIARLTLYDKGRKLAFVGT